MAGFVMGGGRCAVCKRGGCIPSFHSFEEQERAEQEREREDDEPVESNSEGQKP